MAEWRCTCGKLLGLVRDGKLHVRPYRSHEYMVSLPAEATCHFCGAVSRSNENPEGARRPFAASGSEGVKCLSKISRP
jgi:hypothetical protein